VGSSSNILDALPAVTDQVSFLLTFSFLFGLSPSSTKCRINTIVSPDDGHIVT